MKASERRFRDSPVITDQGECCLFSFPASFIDDRNERGPRISRLRRMSPIFVPASFIDDRTRGPNGTFHVRNAHMLSGARPSRVYASADIRL